MNKRPPSPRHGAKASVNAFDIVVTVSNSFGLPIGTHIIVAHSDASVTTA